MKNEKIKTNLRRNLLKRKSKPLIWSTLFLCLVLCGGIFYYFSQTREGTMSQKSPSKMTQTTDKTKNTSQKEKKSKAEKNPVKASQPSESKSTVEQKTQEEQKAFNKEVLSQNYYVEHVDDKGNLTYVKATEKELQALETKNNSLSTYQVNYEGQLISVLATH